MQEGLIETRIKPKKPLVPGTRGRPLRQHVKQTWISGSWHSGPCSTG